MTASITTVDLECEDLDRLLLVAIRAADQHREPVLVVLKRPATGYGSGCQLAYVTPLSQATAFEKRFAYKEVQPGGAR